MSPFIRHASSIIAGMKSRSPYLRALGACIAMVSLTTPCLATDIELSGAAGDPARAAVARMARSGQRDVEAFFRGRFPEPVHLKLAASRAEFDAAFPASWGMGRTECWMVAVGVADFLVMLSPTAWQHEACDHDPNQAQEVQRIISHELVHVFHGQRNPTRDFAGADD